MLTAAKAVIEELRVKKMIDFPPDESVGENR